jgi:hypothetical protein
MAVGQRAWWARVWVGLGGRGRAKLTKRYKEKTIF